jgi:branched-chain amino acid transport system substrate-binding protein
MSADPRRLAAVALAAAALSAHVGCGGSDDPLRVGVLVDCTGVLEAFGEGTFAGAELPFRERDGRAGGREVELVKGCTEVAALTLAISQTRRLIEEEGVDVILGPVGDTEGVLMRRLAPRYPNVTFILGATAAQEATLRVSQPNVFRFGADGAQSAAGLADYAYRELGWRRAAVAFDYVAASWDATAGFVAEFCSLGGTVEDQGAFVADRADRAVAARLARKSDGVFVSDGFYPVGEFLRAYARAVGNLPPRLLLNGYGLSLPGALPPEGVDLSGVVMGGDIPLRSERPEWRRYLRAFARAFPELPRAAARDQLVLPYYVGMEGLARALERTGGEIGPGGRTLRRALARVAFTGPMGRIHLDTHRQAVVSVHLRRLSTDGDRVSTRPVRVIDDVDESFGGTFTPRTPTPSLFSLRCHRGKPPPWARG